MKVTFLNKQKNRKTITCNDGEKLLHAGLRHGIPLPYECGTGHCGTCVARAKPGTVQPNNPDLPGSKNLNHQKGEFLLCQSSAYSDCNILVDFKDHLGGGLNNMRFPSSFWELNWFALESGFYTNRMRLSEIILICEEIGFTVHVKSSKRWTSLPIKRTQLASEFYDLSNDDLLTSGSHLVMNKKYIL